MVHQVQSFQEFQDKINGDKLVVVDFFATWCGPCRVVAPLFEKLSSETENVDFIKVDVDQIPDAAQLAGVRAMPTFAFYQNGEKRGEVVGANIAGVKDKLSALTA